MSAFPANLLINADDFGIHPRVSKAIASAVDEGLIHSFSVLPFEDGFHRDLLKDVLARHPGVKVGAHLTVLSRAEGLAEGPGHFRDFLARYLTGRYPLDKVRDEWNRQVTSLGGYLGGPGRLSHLDGHQHLHILPGLWKVAREIKTGYRIPRLRVPYEGLVRTAFHKFPFGLGLQGAAWLRRGPEDRRLIGFATSTCFTVDANRALLEEVIRHPERTYELMVHPALPGREGPSEGAPAPSQERELDELRKLKGFFAERSSRHP